MTGLDLVLPTPRKLELSSVELALTPERAWDVVRHEDLARSALVKALFALRTLPSRFSGTVEKVELRLDALASSPERPGFQILIDEPREVVVGAIGQVWQIDIPFVHVDGPAAYAAFSVRSAGPPSARSPRSAPRTAWSWRVRSTANGAATSTVRPATRWR